jgi:hypothetical protein
MKSYYHFKPGETVYLKEPYYIDLSDGLFAGYVYGSTISEEAKKYCKRGNKLFMPEKSARYHIKITGVKAERLQDITDSDCVKEGIRLNPHYDDDVRDKKILIASNHYIVNYADFIDTTHGKGTWESNPFVFVYDFKLK